MTHVYREALVPYTQQQMYDLVNNVHDYPTFLPWCKSVRVLEQNEKIIKATLLLAKGGIHKTFTTKNSLTPFERIDIDLIDGPFKKLSGHWRFLTQPSGQTKVSVDLEFEFSSRILALLLEPVFTEVSHTLVSAFTKEAHRRYGNVPS